MRQINAVFIYEWMVFIPYGYPVQFKINVYNSNLQNMSAKMTFLIFFKITINASDVATTSI